MLPSLRYFLIHTRVTTQPHRARPRTSVVDNERRRNILAQPANTLWHVPDHHLNAQLRFCPRVRNTAPLKGLHAQPGTAFAMIKYAA